MSANDSNEKPRWLRDLIRFLPLKSQFVLSGNVRDLQITRGEDGSATPQGLIQHLAMELRSFGYRAVVSYEQIHGFRVVPSPTDTAQSIQALVAELGIAEGTPVAIEEFSTALERIVGLSGAPIALVADFASRLVVRNDVLAQAEHNSFTRALIASHNARARPFGTPSKPFFNSVIWITDKEGDLPDWMLIGNPRTRHIPIAKPDHQARRGLATSMIKGLAGFSAATPVDQQAAIQTFVDETESLLLLDVQAIVQLGRAEGLPFSQMSDAVRRYKVGVTEDPWAKIDRQKVLGATEFVTRRVKGQAHAVTHILDIVKRAVVGFGGTRRGGRPRGVVFLAGPTGVGKTELAKTITSLLFGDESAYIRFDMSEFSAEHADQRLIGAPPGYVGYDVGGELTNAVREKPFSVVLFDEIEKAHPKILDKFLQVLDDGVLTSGRGDRVYFSETLIIFTSNLGIYRLDPSGQRVVNVSAADDHESIQKKVKSEIESYFKTTLNRPEILNRIGDNVIVFDFIRDDVASQIFEGMCKGLLGDLQSQLGIEIALSIEATDSLKQACLADLSNGGRGIRNKVEAHLINPLARALFDGNAAAGDKFMVVSIASGQIGTLNLVKR